MLIDMAGQVVDRRKARGAGKPVRLVLFHDRGPHDSILLEAFNRALADGTFAGREMFSTIAPLSSVECIPLQAADLLAYENYKDSERVLKGRRRRKTLELFLEMSSFGGRARTFNPAAIRMLRQVEILGKAGLGV
jgi:hypothetical protein